MEKAQAEIAAIPRLERADQFIWSAFYKLRPDQPPGYGCVGHIPWPSISQFATRYDIGGEDFDAFLDMIRFIEEQDKRITQSQQNPGPR